MIQWEREREKKYTSPPPGMLSFDQERFAMCLTPGYAMKNRLWMEHVNADTLIGTDKKRSVQMRTSYPGVATKVEPAHVGGLLSRFPLRRRRRWEVWYGTLMKLCSIDVFRVVAWSRS
jgi:hypothetical protein